jgi:hypothetical protein
MSRKKSISHTCASRALAPVLRGKKLPRGTKFQRGNTIGIATRFQPGNRANPGGRPKSKLISEALRWMLATPISRPILPETKAEELAAKLISLGRSGKLGAIIEVADRSEGRPATTLNFGEHADPLAEMIREMNRLSLQAGPPEEPDCDETETVN